MEEFIFDIHALWGNITSHFITLWKNTLYHHTKVPAYLMHLFILKWFSEYPMIQVLLIRSNEVLFSHHQKKKFIISNSQKRIAFFSSWICGCVISTVCNWTFCLQGRAVCNYMNPLLCWVSFDVLQLILDPLGEGRCLVMFTLNDSCSSENICVMGIMNIYVSDSLKICWLESQWNLQLDSSF